MGLPFFLVFFSPFSERGVGFFFFFFCSFLNVLSLWDLGLDIVVVFGWRSLAFIEVIIYEYAGFFVI